MFDDRKIAVLGALVERYISTGEPVSSQAILDASGLSVSAATIRNDLVALEAEGFVIQPHTSAGRVPTERAYRYYVDQLGPTKLRRPSLNKIHSFFASVHTELTSLLKETSDLMAEVSHYPAVVIGPGLAGETLRGIHLVPLASTSAMVVLVSDAGRVSQELIRFDQPIGTNDINAAETALAGELVGRPMADAGDVRGDVIRGLAPDAADVARAALSAAREVQTVTRDIYVGGTSQMAAVWEDLAKVHRILELLERETAVVGLMQRGPDGTNIHIGEELEITQDVDVAVVSADYEIGDDAGGRIGVIGPMRMDYKRAISVVEEVSEGLSEQLGSQS